MTTVHVRAIASLLIGLLLLAPVARSDEPPQISDSQAASHIGEYAAVEGKVAAVFTSNKGNTFLNFGAAHPNQRFSGVIFARVADAFSDLHALEGKRVRLTGTISLYRGKPQIILESPGQLRVLK